MTFNNKLSILQNYKKNFLKKKPYPYFEIKNALPENIYLKLKSEHKIFQNFFEINKNFNQNNYRIQINSEEIFKRKRDYEKSIWYDFVKFHTSKDFFLNLIDIFYSDIMYTYPKLEKKLYNSNKNLVSYRSKTNNYKYEFVTDCQPGINTPVKEISSVRGPHVDNPVELIGGLFYLKDDNEGLNGGDLEIYEQEKDIFFTGKAEVDNIYNLKLSKTIRYDRNHCVFFLNTYKSIHGVTQRNINNHQRYLTNIIVERYKDDNKFFSLKRKLNIKKKFFNFFKI